MSTAPGFWRRQFLLPPTRAQTRWDLASGIALPLACLGADRILFTVLGVGPFRGSIFGPVQPFCTGFILTELWLLGVWLFLRRKLGRSADFFGGPFLAGWLFAVGVGLLLLPFSAVGLLVGIGLLGFSPWLAAFTLLRNWKMARAISRGAGAGRRPWLALAGMLFALTPALAVQARADYLVRRLVEAPQSDRRIEQARHFPLFPAQELASAWAAETDQGRKAALSRAHYELTGFPLRPER